MPHMPVSTPTVGRILDLDASTDDPSTDTGSVQVYGRTTAGVVQVFARTSDGTVHQLTPVPTPLALSGAYWIDAQVDHGCTGDGSTDDRVAVLAALNAAATAAAAGTGNVIVFFPPGIYNVSRSGANSYSIDVPGNNYTIAGVRRQTWFRHPTGMPNASVAIFRVDSKQGVTFRDVGFDGNWGNAVTTVKYSSHSQSLSAVGFTLNVIDTTGFPSSGTFGIVTSDGVRSDITYSGKTSTSFTGCSGGTGIAYTGNKCGYHDTNGGLNHTEQVDPKNYGLMIRGSSGIRIEHCDFRQIYGDAIWTGYASDDDRTKYARDIHVFDCTIDITARNGISLGGAQERVYIERCHIDNVFTEPIDSEPQSLSGRSWDVYIDKCFIRGWWDQNAGGDSGQNVAISCCGGYTIGNNQRSSARNWRITNCQIHGATLIFAAIDIQMVGNRIVMNQTSVARAPIFVDHSAQDIVIDKNYIYDNGEIGIFSSHVHDGSIHVQHYGSGDINVQPSSVKITRNEIHCRKGVAGIFVDGVGGFTRGDGTPVLPAVTGTATGVTGTTMTHTGAGWTTNRYQGWEVILGGLKATIESNTSDTLTLAQNVNEAMSWYTPLGEMATTPSTGTYTITSVSGVLDISFNDIDCGADGNTAGGNGIYLFNDRAGGRIRCYRNNIKNANQYAIFCQGSAADPLLTLELVSNYAWDDQVSATALAVIRFANAASLTSIGKLIMRDNIASGGMSTVLSNVSSGTWLLEDGDAQRWTGYGAPTMSAPKGSTYQRKDPADGNTTLYVNASGSTTWVALTG